MSLHLVQELARTGVADALLAERDADIAAMRMHNEMKEVLLAAVDTLIEQHPILLTAWNPSGFPMPRSEFAGMWLTDLALSTKLSVNDRTGGAAA